MKRFEGPSHQKTTGLDGDYFGNNINKNIPVKPIDSWSRGIGRRLLVEPSFESLHPTLPLEMEECVVIFKSLPLAHAHAHTPTHIHPKWSMRRGPRNRLRYWALPWKRLSPPPRRTGHLPPACPAHRRRRDRPRESLAHRRLLLLPPRRPFNRRRQPLSLPGLLLSLPQSSGPLLLWPPEMPAPDWPPEMPAPDWPPTMSAPDWPPAPGTPSCPHLIGRRPKGPPSLHVGLPPGQASPQHRARGSILKARCRLLIGCIQVMLVLWPLV
ncbi:unnamed protein product [Protopolystoma xenopodis]|uniref:Uncharacterized protein n=1 Tax=Protopolystoma xenopodis TaxID=117903 RepID=A0A3S5C7P8_9PLAT|nr:unnamed protein product [Protopolystoma xenopodis]